MTDETRGIGDNNPPPESETIHARLDVTYPELAARRDELLRDRAPETVADEETNKACATYAKSLQAFLKQVDAHRRAEKAEYRKCAGYVDGWFSQLSSPVNAVKEAVEDRQTEYQRDKSAAELRRRKEIERVEREKAELLTKEHERREREARHARGLAADAARRDAMERAAQQAVAEKQAAAAAVAAAAVTVAKRAAAEEAKKAARAVKAAAQEAKRQEAAAGAASNKAAAGLAELSRTRSDEGAVASLKSWFDFEESTVNRADLDLEALRQHLPVGALYIAIRSYIKAEGKAERTPLLRGIVIFKNSRTVNH